MLEGARFGLLMNRASVNRDLQLACDVLNASYPGQLAKLFTPQHGLWGDVQANMVETPHGRHPRLDLPIYSLYSETRRPAPEMLADLDCLVIDLQDVGTRVYTFAWTVLECLKACSDMKLPVLVLDRPNPIGGTIVEGPLLDPAFRSFVGGASIPMRHGLTIGELAQRLNAEPGVQADLAVVPVSGWTRSWMFPELGRQWIPPSPNLPCFESTLVYAGQVLLEGTNLSEGRGTTTPFRVAGAPYVDGDVLCNTLTSLELPGVRFLPHNFRPTFDKWAGQLCGGVSLHITNAFDFRPYRTSVALIAAVHSHWPGDFAWIPPPYEYETTKLPIDILSGSASLRNAVDQMSSMNLTELEPSWKADRAWRERSAGVMMHDRSCQTEFDEESPQR